MTQMSAGASVVVNSVNSTPSIGPTTGPESSLIQRRGEPSRALIRAGGQWPPLAKVRAPLFGSNSPIQSVTNMHVGLFFAS